MRRSKTFSSWFLVVFLAVGGIAPSVAALTPVADYLHTAQTVLHYIGRLIEISQKYQQIYNQYQQIANEYQQIANQVKGLEKLDIHWARNIVGTMDRMEQILRRSDLPSHVNDLVESIHRELYPGWRLPRNYWREEEDAATATIETLRETLGAQHQAFVTNRDHIRTLLELKNQVKTIDGTEKALEVLAGIAAFHAEVGTLSEVSLATSADAATAFYSYQVNAAARQKKAIHDAFEASAFEPPTLEPGRGWGALPNWWH